MSGHSALVSFVEENSTGTTVLTKVELHFQIEIDAEKVGLNLARWASLRKIAHARGGAMI